MAAQIVPCARWWAKWGVVERQGLRPSIGWKIRKRAAVMLKIVSQQDVDALDLKPRSSRIHTSQVRLKDSKEPD